MGPLALAIGDFDKGLYVLDLTWNIRKILSSGVVIVVALASYVDSAVCSLPALPTAAESAPASPKPRFRLNIKLPSIPIKRDAVAAAPARLSSADSSSEHGDVFAAVKAPTAAITVPLVPPPVALPAPAVVTTVTTTADTGRLLVMRGLAPRPDLGRHLPAPYIRYLQKPRCLSVDLAGNMFVGVQLPSSVGISWVSAGNIGPRGLTACGLKVRVVLFSQLSCYVIAGSVDYGAQKRRVLLCVFCCRRGNSNMCHRVVVC